MTIEAASPHQLRRLLDAVIAVGSELSPPVVLDRIVHLATELVGARYGALGVLDEHHTRLVQFLTAVSMTTTAAPSGPCRPVKGSWVC